MKPSVSLVSAPRRERGEALTQVVAGPTTLSMSSWSGAASCMGSCAAVSHVTDVTVYWAGAPSTLAFGRAMEDVFLCVPGGGGVSDMPNIMRHLFEEMLEF
jgi:hypothetical protein